MYDNIDWKQYPGFRNFLICIGIIGLVGFNLMEPSQQEFVCITKRCEVVSKNFLGIVISNKKIKFSEIEKFEIAKSRVRHGSGRSSFKSDRYYLHAAYKNGNTIMLMDTSNQARANDAFNRLNSALESGVVDINIKF